jgi:AcrR family transcriptional regulator
MAADEFRQHGIVTSGIADVMAAVGLTHGGFYRHFESKEQLVAEATAAALDTLLDTLASAGLREFFVLGIVGVTSRNGKYSVNGILQSIFRSASVGDHPPNAFPVSFRRDAGLKMLCVMCDAFDLQVRH